MFLHRFYIIQIFLENQCAFMTVSEDLGHVKLFERITAAALSCWHVIDHDYIFFILSPCCCSVTQSCPTLCNSMECNMPGLSVPHYLLKLSQVHVHGISDATQPSHPLTPSSPPTLSLSQHWGLFQWVSCSHQMTKILELQHQSFQRVFRVDFP